MKDKEKQIEEMANCEKCVCKPVCMKTADIVKEQEFLSWNEYVKSYGCKHYQPKLPKDSVVLTREEYKELKHYENEMYRLQSVVDQLTNEGWDILDEKEEKIRKSERKETAEKILNELVGHTFEDDGWTWTVSKEDIQWLADKYGIKIKD